MKLMVMALAFGLVALAHRSATAEPMIRESLARQVVETKANLALKHAEWCFYQARIMLSAYEAKLLGVRLDDILKPNKSIETKSLLRAGFNLEGVTDQAVIDRYDACIDEIRPELKAP